MTSGVSTTSLNELIIQTASAGVQQLSDGQMPAGHNGPYDDPETPVRNSSHWLVTFLHAYEIDGNEIYREAAEEIVKYLLSEEARPHGYTFYHRTNPEKDHCNGLIGQAWTIEALAEAANHFEDDRVVETATKVFLLHPFDRDRGLWERIEVDGSNLSFDLTFNHQLWFAASGGLLARHTDDEIEARVRTFLNHVPEHLGIYNSGLIRHAIRYRSRVRNFVRDIRQRLQGSDMHSKCIGYHSFNTYAFALLYQQFPDHPVWKSEPLVRTIKYLQSDAYRKALENNRYGYPYNPPGFEVPFTYQIFGLEDKETRRKWISKQLRRCYDFESDLMIHNTEDSPTHAARIYEATRLQNMRLDI